ncbi:MAG: HepT-like ribonuclease domain-containing protein [Chloroflexota bacterium]|nr:HepT-like ribonuclease domain-containing protein [Chloroflexota bacterium]
MLDYAQEAVQMTADLSRADLDTNRQLNLALMRLMEVIGEAAIRVPDDFRSRYPKIPWQQISALRNRLIHGYDVVDFDILWAVIHDDCDVNGEDGFQGVWP